jgi:hypothetical protein
MTFEVVKFGLTHEFKWLNIERTKAFEYAMFFFIISAILSFVGGIISHDLIDRTLRQ